MNKKIVKILIFIILITALVFIFYLIFKNNNALDNKSYNLIKNYINDSNTSLAKFFTFLGSTLFITILCIISLFIKKYRYIIISNTLIVVGISQALKFIIQRNRPLGINLIEETGYSFPSGHSMVSCAFYGLIIYLIFKSSLKKSVKTLLIILLTSFILLIGISRIYLGVHYTTDVIGGYTLALIHLFLFIEFIYKKYFNKNV